MTLTYIGCEITYRRREKSTLWLAQTVFVTDPTGEGPRAVRLGDSLSAVLRRFPQSGNDPLPDGSLLLYGGDIGNDRGILTAVSDTVTEVRLACGVADGRTAWMLLTFRDQTLDEILIVLSQPDEP